MGVLFTLLAASYERDGVLLIGDLVFSKWEGIFTNPVTTAAAVGRTVHRSIILELNILSYEMEQAPRDRTQVAAPGEPAGAGSATHTDQ